MVRLKALDKCINMPKDEYFNSTMVRLKEKVSTKLEVIEVFQFHNGTIKRDTAIERNCIVFVDFNSTMVRLKAFVRRLEESKFFYFNSTMVRLKGVKSDVKMSKKK